MNGTTAHVGTPKVAKGDTSSNDLEAGRQKDMDRLTSYSHHWEHRVFEKGAPVGDAASIHHHGPTVFGRRLFLTKVSGHDEAGNKIFTWSHRRHRKSRLQEHELPEKPGKIRWWDWLNIVKWHDTPQHAVSWWIAAAFFFGSIFFTIGGVAEIIKPVIETSTDGAGSLDDWLLNYPYAIGATVFFLPGVYLVLIEIANTDYDMRVHNWKAEGCLGTRPRYKWFPVKVDSFLWWSTLVMFTGACGFTIATTATVLQVDIPYNWDFTKEKWWEFFPLTYGGAAFTAASVVYCWEASHCWYKGFIPLDRNDLYSIPFWVNFFQLWGSVGFLLSGACYFKENITWGGEIVELVLGYLIGSIFFAINGWLLWIELINPERPDHPS